MFSQVVGTLLRLTDEHAQSWVDVQTSHHVPIYGFERYADPPPLDVNVTRLLDEFARGLPSVGDAWRQVLAAETLHQVEQLAADAQREVDAVSRADTPMGIEDATFSFPDDVWAHVIGDVAVAAHQAILSIDTLVAALVPIYFGRVAGFVIETRDLTTQQAETVVERQARAFELAKSGFVAQWQAAS